MRFIFKLEQKKKKRKKRKFTVIYDSVISSNELYITLFHLIYLTLSTTSDIQPESTRYEPTS